MAVRFRTPFTQWVNGNSEVEEGAKLYFYTTGTSTPKTTYSDAALTIANANPVVADANGKFGDIFLGAGLYKAILKDNLDVTIWTADPIGDSLEDVTITGTFAINGVLTPAQITADTNNYDPSGLASAVTLRISSDASRTLTGLAGGAAGRIIIMRNVGSFNIVMPDDNASSTAANRFALFSNIILEPDQAVTLQYDTASSRWFPIAVPATSFLTTDISISSTDAGSSVKPTLFLDRNSASPAANDLLGQLQFSGRDSAGNGTSYSYVGSAIADPTNGTEAGVGVLGSIAAGTIADRWYWKLGIYAAGGITGSDKGAGTINALGYYKSGTVIPFQTQYESPLQTITASSVITLAHGLGAAPNNGELILVNQTGEHNFTAGQETPVQWDAGSGRGIQISWDATNVYITVSGTAYQVLNRTTGAAGAITLASWKIKARAWV